MPAYPGLDAFLRGAREQAARLAEEVGQASRANRDLVEQLVVAEVARVAARVGLVPRPELQEALDLVAVLQADVAALRERVEALETARAEPGAST